MTQKHSMAEKAKGLNIIMSNYINGFMEFSAVARRWGNSLGITLPKQIVEQTGIRENQEVNVEIKTKSNMPSKEIFGFVRDWRLNAQKVKDEARKEDARRDKKLSGLLRSH